MAALHWVQTGRRSPPSNMIRENGIDWFWIFYFWQNKENPAVGSPGKFLLLSEFTVSSMRLGCWSACSKSFVVFRTLNQLLYFYSLHLLLLIFLILLRTEHYIRRRQCSALTFFSLSVWGRLGSAYFLLLSRFLAKNNCQISTLRLNCQCSAKRDA